MIDHRRLHPRAFESLRIAGAGGCVLLPLLFAAACSSHTGTPREEVTPSDSAGEPMAAFVTEFTDIGGEILEITLRDGTKIFPATLAQLHGTVYDSITGGSLEGARVTVSGTDFTAVTDSVGEYRLAVPLDGEYVISFSHPRLDSVGFSFGGDTVHLAREATTTVTSAIPSLGTINDLLCGDLASGNIRTTIVGAVTTADGEPVPGADVWASWQEIAVPNDSTLEFLPQELSHNTFADEEGFFTLCGLPRGHSLFVQAENDGTRSGTVELVFPWTDDGSLLLARDRTPGEAFGEVHSAPPPIWRLDLQLGGAERSQPATQGGSLLTGIVADRMTGHGLAGVTVTVNDVDSTTTRADGTYYVTGMEWVTDQTVISFRRLGYHPWTWRLALDRSRRNVVLSVLLRPIAYALDPVIVEAERVNRRRYLENAGYFRRERSGLGHHVSPDHIDARRAEVNDVSDFMIGIPGVTIMELGEPVELTSGETVAGKLLVLGYGRNRCVPSVYVDGIPTAFGASITELGAYVWPEDVSAIEVYRRWSEAPVEYGSGCLVLIWTRRGRP